MGTRSFIARKTDNGYIGVYCHWDGYLKYNGRILREHYTDPYKVEQLIAHGDMSSLGKEVGSQHDFDNPPDSETNYYGRDRGEEGTAPTTRKTLRALMNFAKRRGCEFFYLYRDGSWEYAKRWAQYFGRSDGSPFSKLQPLPKHIESL